MSKKRSEIDDKYKWDLTKIFKDEKEVYNEIEIVKKEVEDVLKYKNHIMDSDINLYEATTKYFDLMRKIENIVVYSNMDYHTDMSDSKKEKLVGLIDKLTDDISEKLAFYTPEILKSEYSLVEKYISENEELKTYEFTFKELFREKEHILSLKEEEMMARLGEILSSSEDTFHMLDDVNLKFKNIKDENGNEVELNSSNYSTYIKSYNRDVRRDAFTSMFTSYKNFKNTFSSLLKSNIKSNFFVSRTRKYNSPLEMSLNSDNIDIKLYKNLIDKVNDKLYINHEYMELRKKVLGLDELHMYDVYTPLVKNIEKNYTYDEAKDLVLKALAPLGDTYIKDLTNLFNSNIIDIYPNQNKRSGAYSWGSYDSYPYALLNFEGKFSDVSTIAHELGHSMHSYYSHKNNPYHLAGYPIFLAEIASTVNEIFLNKYCYKNSTSKEEKLFYLNNLLENYRTTLFRQTMFAEFELKVHELEDSGEVLTEEVFSNIYLDLNKKYFGDNTISDELIKYEWARIPHFYTSFYVYKYATGISVASKIVYDILNEKEGARENYLKFLSSGGNDFPLEILKKTGIDIVNDDTIDKALEMYEDALKDFKALI